ncbi:MAG: hypothetical protein KAG99_01110, partial [Bacteroidales bacterium]|nr:hypothetical protein [Bacteroidales bacterium]
MTAFAQAPQAFKYQAIARDHDGTILSNQQISVEVKLIQGSNRGVAVYSEQHFTTTNDFGLISLTIGQGVERTGDFRNIDWSIDSYLVEIGLDKSGGTNFEVMGIAQLLSVPYALYAEQSGSDSRENDLDWGKRLNDKLDVYTGTGNGYPDGNVGIGTFIPKAKLEVAYQYGFGSSFMRVNNSPGGNPIFMLRRARGSINLKTAAQNGDNIGQIVFEAYDGSNFKRAAAVSSRIDGPVSPGIVSASLGFHTRDTLGVMSTKMRIYNYGLVDVLGYFQVENGTSVNEISIDSLLADQSDDAVVTEKAIKWYVDHTVPGQDYLYHNVLIRFDSLQKKVVNSTVFDEDTHVQINNNLDVNGWLDVSGAVDLAAAGVLTNVRGPLSVDGAAVFDKTVDVIDSTRLHGTLEVTGITKFYHAQESTHKDEGAVVLENGGLGVEKNITSGQDIWAYHRLISGNTITIDGTLPVGSIEESHGKITFVDDTIHTDGAIGVGTLFPKAEIHVTKDNGVVAEGTFGSGTLGVEGAGVRMLWYPKKAAFRAGSTDTTWNDDYIGDYSAAFGNKTIAIGSHSVAGGLMTSAGSFAVAFGNNTQANGRGSVAMGDHTTADGDFSAAFGKYSAASGDYSFVMGEQDTASASNTVAMGINNKATASAAIALGSYNAAGGLSSFAGGNHSAATANGDYSFAFGEYDTVSGPYAIAMGRNNKATQSQAVALGGYNTASGNSSFAGGNLSVSSAGTSFAFGEQDTASNTYAVAFGYKSKATGSASFAEGSQAVASANYSVAMGNSVTASGGSSVAFGWGTEAHGTGSFAFGKDTYANGSGSFAGGEVSRANGHHSFAMGDRDTAFAANSFALGFHTKTTSRAEAALAMGQYSSANGDASFAGGIRSYAGGNYSFAMGQNDTANAPRSVAFGYQTKATDADAFAMGHKTIAGGNASLAAGYNSHAVASYSRAMGHSDTARGIFATAMGQGINARSINVTSIGRFNLGNGSMSNWNATDPIFEIGIGTNNANRLNAMTVYKNGSATMMGPVTITDATESTSSTTGALIVAGGIGAGKNINAGGTVASGATITMDGTYTTTAWASTLDDSQFNRIHFMDDTLTTMGW